MARLALIAQVAGVVDVAPEYRMEEIEISRELRGRRQADQQTFAEPQRSSRSVALTARSSAQPAGQPG